MLSKEPRSVYEEARLDVISLAGSDVISTSADLSFGGDDYSNISDGGWV